MPEMAAALRRHDANAVLRILYRDSALSQTALATMAGISQASMSAIVAQRSPLRRPERHDEILRRLRSSMPPAPAASAAPAPRGQAHDPTGAAGARQLTEQLRDADPAAIDLLTDRLRQLATAYVHQSPAPLIGPIMAVRDSAVDAYRAGARPRHARQLLLLAAGASLLLAHAAQNLGDTSAANAHLAAAYHCGTYAEHEQLSAWARGSSALLAEWSPRPALAVERAGSALAQAPAGHAAIRAAAIEARAAARIGERDRSRAALDRLTDARSTPAADEDLAQHLGGLFAFPAAKEQVYRADAHLLTGDHDAAVTAAQQALHLYAEGPEQDYSYGDAALALVTLATAHLHQRDWQAAQEPLEALLGLPEHQRIQQLSAALAPLRRVLSQPPMLGDARARALAERLSTYRVLDASHPRGLTRP